MRHLKVTTASLPSAQQDQRSADWVVRGIISNGFRRWIEDQYPATVVPALTTSLATEPVGVTTHS